MPWTESYFRMGCIFYKCNAALLWFWNKENPCAVRYASANCVVVVFFWSSPCIIHRFLLVMEDQVQITRKTVSLLWNLSWPEPKDFFHYFQDLSSNVDFVKFLDNGKGLHKLRRCKSKENLRVSTCLMCPLAFILHLLGNTLYWSSSDTISVIPV